MNSTTKTNQGIYDAKELGVPKMILLGLQHAFAMFGATVLVPLLTGLSVSTTLLMAGIGTLIFHFLTKGKVPAFLGSSFAFIGGYNLVAPLIDGTKPNVEMLPYACGGVFVAGLVYIVLSLLIQIFGVKRIMRFFPPVVTGPIIISIGLILLPSAIDNCKTNWLLAVIAISVIVLCSTLGKGMVKIVPIMLGITASYIVALATGNVDFEAVKTANLFASPISTANFMKFDISSIITIVPIALATMIEHIGDICAISATTGRNYIADPGLHRTLLGDGLATSFSSIFGGPANTTYGENTGVLALTKVYDPIVMQIAACFAIVLSFLPAVSALITSIPNGTIGGVSLILYALISTVGVRNLREQNVSFKKWRNVVIVAVTLVCALVLNYMNGITFEINQITINLSGLAIASIVGIILNIILPGNDYDFELN